MVLHVQCSISKSFCKIVLLCSYPCSLKHVCTVEVQDRQEIDLDREQQHTHTFQCTFKAYTHTHCRRLHAFRTELSVLLNKSYAVICMRNETTHGHGMMESCDQPTGLFRNTECDVPQEKHCAESGSGYWIWSRYMHRHLFAARLQQYVLISHLLFRSSPSADLSAGCCCGFLGSNTQRSNAMDRGAHSGRASCV